MTWVHSLVVRLRGGQVFFGSADGRATGVGEAFPGRTCLFWAMAS